ncbi:hypothetical protein [Gandjariella thermophila]|uniref:Uncharacterized protein n=1 Tax=Gandjariella thermophila TaxID=1931992 RepID=A0A4D4JCJ4_9PSEU|nr:hypothetical protein [Gandjariella thermophila]GDY33092.1 hypothetical protein GTS_47250 [Gandjariella thermophila]
MTTPGAEPAGDRTPDPRAARVANLSRQLGDQLLAGQTPQQQAIARRIFDDMRAGAEVDQVKDLIAELSRTATEDQRRRDGQPATQPPRMPARSPQAAAENEEEWVWKWDGNGR